MSNKQINSPFKPDNAGEEQTLAFRRLEARNGLDYNTIVSPDLPITVRLAYPLQPWVPPYGQFTDLSSLKVKRIGDVAESRAEAKRAKREGYPRMEHVPTVETSGRISQVMEHEAGDRHGESSLTGRWGRLEPGALAGEASRSGISPPFAPESAQHGIAQARGLGARQPVATRFGNTRFDVTPPLLQRQAPGPTLYGPQQPLPQPIFQSQLRARTEYRPFQTVNPTQASHLQGSSAASLQPTTFHSGVFPVGAFNRTSSGITAPGNPNLMQASRIPPRQQEYTIPRVTPPNPYGLRNAWPATVYPAPPAPNRELGVPPTPDVAASVDTQPLDPWDSSPRRRAAHEINEWAPHDIAHQLAQNTSPPAPPNASLSRMPPSIPSPQHIDPLPSTLRTSSIHSAPAGEARRVGQDRERRVTWASPEVTATRIISPSQSESDGASGMGGQSPLSAGLSRRSQSPNRDPDSGVVDMESQVVGGRVLRKRK